MKNDLILDTENIEDIYPASDIQLGMIYHSLIKPGIYHDQMVHLVRIPEFDPDVMNKALFLMMNKHSILRTGFLQHESNFLQVVYKRINPFIQHFIISDKNEYEQREIIKNHLIEDRNTPFEIQKPGLWRIITFKLSSDSCCICFISHHAIIDGWSDASFNTELNNIYFSLRNNADFVPKPLMSSYKDFVVDQIAALKNTESFAYWQRELADYKRFSFRNFNDVGSYLGKSRRLSIELNEMLKLKSARTEISIKHLCFSTFIYTLNMFSYDSDLTVGLITNNRPVVKDADKILGCFLNTVPVRIKVPGEILCSKFLKSVNDKLTNLKKYDSLSLSKIVEIIKEPSSSQNPITDIIFNYADFYVYQQLEDNSGLDSDSLYNTRIRTNISGLGGVRDNSLFSFNVNNTGGHIQYDLAYFTSFISDEYVNTFLEYFEKILISICSDDDPVLTKDCILSDEVQLFRKFNDTRCQFPKVKTIHQQFEEQVKRTPHNIAIVFGPEQISYLELNNKANTLAAKLISTSSSDNIYVGILMERSIELYIAILGVLKSGKAYIPIDRSTPQSRIEYILKDSNIKTLLVDTKIINVELENTINLKEIAGNTFSINNQNLDICSTSPAYVIYTSGSTGVPKGVLVNHSNVINLIYSQVKEFDIRSDEKIFQFSTISFDASVEQIWLALFSGSTLIGVERSVLQDTRRLEDLLNKQLVTHLHAVPSYLNNLDFKKLRRLKRVIAGGDICSIELANKVQGHLFYNEYGPTETTVTSIELRVGKESKTIESLSIGKPIANTNIYIFNTTNNIQPIGVIGELYIGGEGVSEGYLNNPELTHEKFIINPYNTNDYLYKTGDLARWLPDGNIEFIGRIDNQVKIRGYRIELGEIESQIRKIEGVQDVTLKVWEKQVVNKKNNAFNNEESLMKALEKYKNIGSRYDVLVPVSGGVDSCFTLIQLVTKFKLKPLVFHFDHGWENSVATENVIKLCNKLEIDYKILKGDNTFYSKLFKYFNETSHPELCTCTVCGNILYSESIELANTLNIPLVINGYSKGQVEMINDQKKQRRLFTIMMEIAEETGDKEFLNTFKEKLALMNKHKIFKTREDLEKPVDLTKILFIPFFVFQFYRTDKIELQKICQDYFDWQSMPNSYPARTTNCDMVWINSYIDYNFKGFTLYHQEYSTIIRNGEISREQALEDLELKPYIGVLDELGKSIKIDISYLERKLKKDLKVCKKCILPETFPEISFDENGVCNFCNEHKVNANAIFENKVGEKYLCAYIVSDIKLDRVAIKNGLLKSLPDYMIPSYYVQIEKIPLTPNGKIDGKSLPDPKIEVKNYIAPRNDIEAKLVDIWSEVLLVGKEKISIDANFFDLGGNSISFIQVVQKIENYIEHQIKVLDLFKYTSIRELTDYINDLNSLDQEKNNQIDGVNKGKNSMRKLLSIKKSLEYGK